MKPILYHLPVLSTPDLGLFRAPGPGLGNLLFPISRAIVAQKTQGGNLVFPTLRQIKFGTYLRSENDKRTYGEVFRPRTVSEWSTWMRVQTLRRRNEYNVDDDSSSVITYRGLGNQFHDIANYATTIRKYLENVSREPIASTQYDVAIHVRRGDFAPPKSATGTQNVQIPLDWYRRAYQTAIELLGTTQFSSILFSDESPISTIAELGLPNLRPEPEGNALTSMLLMSRARILIASRSTFSLWGQFLGQNVGIWPDGFELGKYKPVDANMDIFA